MLDIGEMTLIRTWKRDGFELLLYDTHGFDPFWDNKARLAYQFSFDGVLIFEGDDYFPSPLHAIDSNQSVAGLLGFLSLRPGDTDAEYFERYSPLQMEFAQENGETLALYAYDLNPENAT